MPAARLYLDNASTSWPKPPAVGAAMSRWLAEGLGTPGRGSHALALEAARLVERTRARLAALVNAPSPAHVILTSGATEALNLVLLGLFLFGAPGRPPRPPRIVATRLEHNAVLRPLRELERRGLAEPALVGCSADGLIDPADLLAAVDERTALVAVTSASNITGALQPVAQVGRALASRSPRPLLLVDAAQSIGLAPIDVASDGIDLLAFSGHKALLGPTGTGALVVSERVPLDDPGDGRPFLAPSRFGGSGHDSLDPGMPRKLPLRFEAGTPNTLGFAGLLAALEDPERLPPERALAHERELAALAIERLGAIPGVRLLGVAPADRRLGVLSFTIDGWSPEEAAAALEGSFGIAVRAGLHCAPLAHKVLGTLEQGGAIRISPGPTTTPDDILALADAVRSLADA